MEEIHDVRVESRSDDSMNEEDELTLACAGLAGTGLSAAAAVRRSVLSHVDGGLGGGLGMRRKNRQTDQYQGPSKRHGVAD